MKKMLLFIALLVILSTSVFAATSIINISDGTSAGAAASSTGQNLNFSITTYPVWITNMSWFTVGTPTDCGVSTSPNSGLGNPANVAPGTLAGNSCIYTTPTLIKPGLYKGGFRQASVSTNRQTISVPRSNYSSYYNITVFQSCPELSSACSTTQTFGLYRMEFYDPYQPNSIVMFMYDEDTGTYIGGTGYTGDIINVSITGTTSAAAYSNVSSRDGIYFTSIVPDTYISTFASANYSTRNYVLTTDSAAPRIANIYLLKGTTTTSPFTIIDQYTSQALQNVIITQERYIGSSWVQVASCLTDVTGACSLIGKPATAYRITITKTGYGQKTFYATSGLSATGYIVKLTSNARFDIGADQYGVGFSYSPKILRRQNDQNFTFSITSPQGKLSSYQWSLQSEQNLSQVYLNTGTDSQGETFTQVVNYSALPLNSRIFLNISYIYNSTWENSYTYILTVGNFSNTLVGNSLNPYNLSLTDRIMIVVMCLLFGAGLAFYFGGFEAGGLVGIFILGYFIATGLLHYFIGITAVILIFFVLAWRAQI